MKPRFGTEHQTVMEKTGLSINTWFSYSKLPFVTICLGLILLVRGTNISTLQRKTIKNVTKQQSNGIIT